MALLAALRAAALFESSRRTVNRSLLLDIPTRWEPRTKQQPAGLIACPAVQGRAVRILPIAQKESPAHKSVSGILGAMEGTRTPGLLIRSQSLYPAELPTHTFRSEHDVFYHSDWVLSTVFCKYFYLFQKAAFFMIFLVSFLSFLCYNSFTICF